MMEFVPPRRGLLVAALVVVSAVITVTIAATLFAVWLMSGGCDVKCRAGETLRASVPAPVSPSDRIPGAGLPARVFFPTHPGGGAA